MKVVKYQLFIAAALLAGVAIGFFAREGEQVPPETAEPAVTHGPIADKGDEASLAALRKRVTELEAALAEKTPPEEGAAPSPDAPTGRADAVQMRSPFAMREWMDNLKKEDPARYAEVTNNIARWRRHRMEQTQSRLAFLSSVDASQLSVSEQKTHAELQKLIARQEELDTELHQEDLSDEQRREIMAEMRETFGAVRRLQGEERGILLRETVRRLGFEGEDVREISATIQDVFEVTGGGHRGR